MTKAIVDTHTLIWFIEKDPRLGNKANDILEDSSSVLIIPVIVLCEFYYYLRKKMKSGLYQNIEEKLKADPRTLIVPITADLVSKIPEKLEMHDGLIAALQTTLNNSVILSKDSQLAEWNSSVLVKNATTKGKSQELLTPTTFSLIHATDFADRYERQLMPLLRAGYLVLCDRYIFTAFARDIVRGCPPEWVRGIYNFAALPDLTLFFKASLEVSLQRILDGRPELKYFEAGMDLRLSTDPYESFRIFQGRILEQYLAMSAGFKFFVIDAHQPIEAQQSLIRDLLAAKIDLAAFAGQKIH